MVRETKRQRGHGITERKVLHRSAETIDEAITALDEIDRVLGDPLARLRHRVALAHIDYLAWRSGEAKPDRGDETIPDLLLQLSIVGSEMEHCLRRGDAERAAALAAGAGELIALLHFKYNWEPAALRGKKLPEDASRGGKERARIIAQERHPSIRADYAERLERLGNESAARAATAKAANISDRQLRRILKGK